MNSTDDPLTERRRSVAAEEASALREEVVRWVRDGEAGESAAEIVRELVRDGLAEQVEMALNSRDLAGQLGEELRSQLSKRFSVDLRQAVVDEVRRALAEGVLRDAELQELRREMRAEVKAALAGGPRRGPGRPSGTGLAPRGPDPRWWLVAAAGVFVLALGLLAGVWWVSRAPAASAPAGGDRVADTDGSGATDVETPAAADADDADGGSPDALAAAWAGIGAAPPAGMAVGRSDLACWFPATTRSGLAALAADARGSGTSIEPRLAATFDPCIESYPAAAGRVVFAAQAAARRALERHAPGNWASCSALPDSPPNVASFDVDGQSGPGTHRLLTAYLTCRGLDTAVTFNNGSSSAEYLFAVYLALTDPALAEPAA